MYGALKGEGRREKESIQERQRVDRYTRDIAWEYLNVMPSVGVTLSYGDEME